MNGRLIINNERIETDDKKESINPATLESLGEFSLASSVDCQKAVLAATEAFPTWSILSLKDKKTIFMKAKAILLKRGEEAAALISREKGSPLTESMMSEVQGSLEVLDYYGKNIKKVLKPRKADHHVTYFSHKKSEYVFHPLGPTLIISPWNYPFIIPVAEVLSTLSAGNTVIFRPSSSTPFTALLFGEIFLEAGLPPGVLNIVCCRIPQAEELITHPDIHSIMFTGSTTTGRRVMELASRNLTKVVLELGGKDPMIVLEDADLERAARGAVWGAFTNCGQVCSSIERVYVQQSVAAEFIDKVVALSKNLTVGDPLEAGTDVGPLAVSAQVDIVEGHIQDAKEKGAHILVGGEKVKDVPGYYFKPTVLTEVDHSMKIMTEETFGPVLPIMTFSDAWEAVNFANDSDYGLTASVWTRNKKLSSQLSKRLHFGSVTINDHLFSFAEPGALWGGVKNTGLGRSHGPYGILELVNIKYISQDFSRKKTQLWWYPYGEDLLRLLKVSMNVFHHSRFWGKIRALPALLPFFSIIYKGSPLRNYIRRAPRSFKN